MPEQAEIVEDHAAPAIEHAGDAARDGERRHHDECEHQLKLQERRHVDHGGMRIGIRAKARSPLREDLNRQAADERDDGQAA